MSASTIDGGILRKQVVIVRNNPMRPGNQRRGLNLMESVELIRAMRGMEQATANWDKLKIAEQNLLCDTAFVLLDVFAEAMGEIDTEPGKNISILLAPHTWTTWYLVNRIIKLSRAILHAAESTDARREQILAERINTALEDASRSKNHSLGVTEAREFIRGL